MYINLVQRLTRMYINLVQRLSRMYINLVRWLTRIYINLVQRLSRMYINLVQRLTRMITNPRHDCIPSKTDRKCQMSYMLSHIAPPTKKTLSVTPGPDSQQRIDTATPPPPPTEHLVGIRCPPPPRSAPGSAFYAPQTRIHCKSIEQSTTDQ
jgi:hypothetical protein